MSSGIERRCVRRSAHWRGFTLVEMLITVAIATILAAIALPSFREFLIRQNTIEIANDLVGSLNTARIEAVKRGLKVRVVPADGSSWSSGWKIDADTANNSFASGTTAVTTHPAIADTYALQGAAAGTGGSNSQIVFSATGAISPVTSTYEFNVCRPSTAADSTQSRRVSVSSSGSVTTHRDINLPSASPAGSC